MHSYFVRGLCRRNAGIDEWVMRPKTQQLWSQDSYQRQARLQRKLRGLIDKRPVERETISAAITTQPDPGNALKV